MRIKYGKKHKGYAGQVLKPAEKLWLQNALRVRASGIHIINSLGALDDLVGVIHDYTMREMKRIGLTPELLEAPMQTFMDNDPRKAALSEKKNTMLPTKAEAIAAWEKRQGHIQQLTGIDPNAKQEESNWDDDEPEDFDDLDEENETSAEQDESLHEQDPAQDISRMTAAEYGDYIGERRKKFGMN